MARGANNPLDRARVMQAAFAILAEQGLAALSMRRLGERLQVQAPALYWHFSGKPELLALMAAAIYADARAEVPPCEDWREWLLAYGASLRQRLGKERDAAQLCAIAQPAPGGASGSPAAIAEPLTKLGLDQDEALSAIANVTSLALGWSTFEANGPMHSFLEEMIDFDESFERGLRALVAGFPAQPAR